MDKHDRLTEIIRRITIYDFTTLPYEQWVKLQAQAVAEIWELFHPQPDEN